MAEPVTSASSDEQTREALERLDEHGALYCRNGHATPKTQAKCQCVGCTARRALSAAGPLNEAEQETCEACDGVGAQPGAHTEQVWNCPVCGGTGRKKVEAPR